MKTYLVNEIQRFWYLFCRKLKNTTIIKSYPIKFRWKN